MEQSNLACGLKQLPFNVTGLDVTIPDGFKFKWHGREIDSGNVKIVLGKPGSHGLIDYEAGTVSVEFRVKIILSELAELLEDIGADTAVSTPVDAVIRSHGVVFPNNHSLRLAGRAEEIGPHGIFNSETEVEILAPTRCEPNNSSRSAIEVKEALIRGEPVTWNFNPTEKRVVLKLPNELGGESHILCLAGSYTLTAANPVALGDVAERGVPSAVV
jgi:hypothetical protein